jgi:flagellar biosynthetic protein FlhB
MAEDEHGEKTETPSEAMIKKAREQGQIAFSRDFATAVVVTLTIFALAVMGERLVGFVRDLLPQIADEIATVGTPVAEGSASAAASDSTGVLGSPDQAARVTRRVAKDLALALAPLLVLAAIGAIAGSVLQTGFNVATKRPLFVPNRINPGQNLKQKMLSAGALIEVGRSVIKILLISAVVYYGVWKRHQDLILGSSQAHPEAMFGIFGDLLAKTALPIAMMLLGIGLIDLLYQRWFFGNQMKVSRQALRQEAKNDEGDPHIKGWRKAIHKQLAMQGMIPNTRTRAAVVLRNPTHLAVAIEYDRATGGVPVIIAKGTDLVAQEILQAAKEGKVPVKRDVQLARSLYPIEVGDPVPVEFHRAVAAVLQWAEEQRNAKRLPVARLGALMARKSPRPEGGKENRRDP